MGESGYIEYISLIPNLLIPNIRVLCKAVDLSEIREKIENKS